VTRLLARQLGSVFGRDRGFSLHHCDHISFGVHPVSYPLNTGGSFPGGKAVGA